MYHTFNYEGQEGTCLWCGRQLRVERQTAAEKDAGEPRKLGDYGDGYLCGLSCGYNFGRRLAELGKRLIKVGEDK